MIELTAEMIIEIHDTTIQRYGGLPGILCQGTIDYLVTRINDEPDHFKKAALALHLIALHPSTTVRREQDFRWPTTF
jgi:hypothetical protein